MRNVMSSDQLKEDRMALENLLANLPQNKPGKSSSLEMTPYNTPQLSPATTPANKKNRLPIGKEGKQTSYTWIHFLCHFPVISWGYILTTASVPVFSVSLVKNALCVEGREVPCCAVRAELLRSG